MKKEKGNWKAGLAALFLVLLAPGAAPAAGLSTGADFLDATAGARPDGMGQAFTAVADDINTLSFNPAGLGNIRLPEVSFSHYQFVSDIAFDFAAAAVPLGRMGTLGLGYLGLGTPPFNSTLDPSATAGTDSESALMAGWGDGWGILQAGAVAKVISRNVGPVSGSGWAVDLGVRLRPWSRLAFGAALLNLGPDITLGTAEALPSDLKLGAAWKMVESPKHSLEAAFDASLPLTTSQAPRFGTGAEYWFEGAFALRAGYLAGTTSEGFTAGAGLRVGGLELDYAYQPYTQLGSTSRFSGSYRFDTPWFAGGELDAPTALTLRPNPSGGATVDWEAPREKVDHYELTITSMDDGRVHLFNVPGPPVTLKKLKPGTLYAVTVEAAGKEGGLSRPSNRAVLRTPEAAAGKTDTKSGGTAGKPAHHGR